MKGGFMLSHSADTAAFYHGLRMRGEWNLNYVEIDRLKRIFSEMLKNQNTLRSMDLGIDGKLIAVGYKPFWTSRSDSKIETLELNFLNSRGLMSPIILRNIVNYELYPKEGKRNKKYRANMIEFMVLSPFMMMRNNKEIYDRVRIEIIYDE